MWGEGGKSEQKERGLILELTLMGDAYQRGGGRLNRAFAYATLSKKTLTC